VVLTVIIGLTLASASTSVIVYAIDLVPGKVGTISGLFFGLSFGLAGIGAALLGRLADMTSIDFIYRLCAFLPLLGLLTVFLPEVGRPARPAPIDESTGAKPALESRA
jgi:MFS transporter, FSR family, fosmidomycin resistance protein